MRILLIDDDQWIRDSMSMFFEGEGCHLVSFETAEEGMDELEKQTYDIVIADYKLPGLDGLELFKWLQKSVQEANQKPIRILITAFGNEKLISEARKVGVQDFIDKPFTTRTIEESLSRLIYECEQENERLLKKVQLE